MHDTATIPAFLSELWNGFKAEAAKFESDALQLARALATTGAADFEDVVRIGAPLAARAVIAEAGRLISGREKFGSAVASVMQQLEAALGPVAVQDAQALVQLAFRSLPIIAAEL